MLTVKGDTQSLQGMILLENLFLVMEIRKVQYMYNIYISTYIIEMETCS